MHPKAPASCQQRVSVVRTTHKGKKRPLAGLWAWLPLARAQLHGEDGGHVYREQSAGPAAPQWSHVHGKTPGGEKSQPATSSRLETLKGRAETVRPRAERRSGGRERRGARRPCENAQLRGQQPFCPH